MAMSTTTRDEQHVSDRRPDELDRESRRAVRLGVATATFLTWLGAFLAILGYAPVFVDEHPVDAVGAFNAGIGFIAVGLLIYCVASAVAPHASKLGWIHAYAAMGFGLFLFTTGPRSLLWPYLSDVYQTSHDISVSGTMLLVFGMIAGSLLCARDYIAWQRRHDKTRLP